MVTSVLITGGTGFLGSAIVDAVQKQHPGWVVTVLDLRFPSVPKPDITYKSGNITNAAFVDILVDSIKPDVIIHSAGFIPDLSFRYGREQRGRVFNVNVNGTRNMLAAAKRSGTAAEALVLSACDEKLGTCALRPSVLFGPGDYQLIPSVHACIAKGETPFVVGDGENLWDVTYVGNVADAHVLAVENLLLTRTAAGEAIFISNEEPIPFRDFCLEVWKNFGHYPPWTPTTLSRGSVLDASGTRYCSGEKARKVIGYKPRVGIEEGIRISCIDYAQRLNLSGANEKLPPR